MSKIILENVKICAFKPIVAYKGINKNTCNPRREISRLMILKLETARKLDSRQLIEREEHALSSFIPFYSIFKILDGEFISFAPLESKVWTRFCLAIDREDLIDLQYDHYELRI
ncbi:MAG: hypothetical protein ACTSW1_09455 [Candidatus Hodarchaeales archaeon]